MPSSTTPGKLNTDKGNNNDHLGIKNDHKRYLFHLCRSQDEKIANRARRFKAARGVVAVLLMGPPFLYCAHVS